MEEEVVELPAAAELEQPSQDQDRHQQLVDAVVVDVQPQQQPNCDAVEQCGGDLIPAERALDERAVAAAAAVGVPDVRRSISGGVASLQVSTLPAAGPIGMRSRSRSSCGGSDGSELVASELVLQLQRLCRRQRQRSEERAFVRDVERVLSLLRVQPSSTSASDATSATFPSSNSSAMDNGVQQEPSALSPTVEAERRASVSSSSSTLSSTSSSTTFAAARHQLGRVSPTLAELDALLDCIADLFEHRNPGVRALAFEVVQLCLLRFGERLTPALRLKVFLRLETHPPGDFLLRQKALRALTQDGRHLEPFCVELGWLLLRLLEQSDAQRDLLALIQSILRRSPHALDRDKVIAISSVVSARCDVAWGRGDLDACRRYVAFFHVLAAHDLAYAACTPACLRSLCCLVNADGHGTWSVLKLLLTGGSGFHVLCGLLQVLEHPHGVNSPWVLRGAVFFVGMSCWGSQRLAKFDDVAWAPILLALEQALQCCRGVVIFEVILALQRLIKKFGGTKVPPSSSQSTPDAAKTPTKLPPSSSQAVVSAASSSSTTATSSSNRDRRLVVEWDIILRMFRTLRPWVSMTDEDGVEDAPHWTAGPDNRRTMEAAARGHHTAAIHPASEPSAHQQQLSVSIQQTRIPRELLDTLEAVEELVTQRRFAGDVDEFLSVLEAYLPHLSESSTLFLLRQRADAAHPGYHVDWLATLSATMRTFFSCYDAEGENLPMPCAVRLQALEVLQVNLWTSRNVCEDRVIEEVVIPALGNVYEDVDAEVRCRGLGFVIEVARQLESVRFDTLLDILASAMTLSSHEDAQLVAASGIVSLFSSAFNHLPPARAVRMYDLLATTVETHRSRAVRRVALTCLLCVCEARATDGRLQWKDQHMRTSRFLFVSRRAARVNASGAQLTVACVPVARALRALLTLVSAEPDAELFRMAVQGIKTMLENRVVLEDVDVSEVAAKVVASIDYRAFGRAAIADEIDSLLSDGTSGSEAGNTREEALVARGARPGEDSQRPRRPISVTDALHASTRSARAISDGGDDTAAFCASLRATAALLAKTRFLAMGLELLQLLVSYEAELHRNALHELIRCLVGALDLRLAVAEKDLFAGGAATDDAVKASSSSQEMLYRRDNAGGQADVSDPYVSGASLTSRVLSRFQASASHGSLFHALSSSVNKSASSASLTTSAAPARPTREDRARLQTFLRQLFETEFTLLHSATTALSLLALLAPTLVLTQLEDVLRCARGCVTTIDGDFRADAFGAVLELLRALVPVLPGARVDDASMARKAIVETLLLGFEYAKSRQLAYMSFRLLCQVIHQSGRRERLTLATLAMPTLQQCACRANSLLAEAAVDFLMCFAYAQSTLAPAALCSRKFESLDPSIAAGGASPSRSRSWVYKSSLLTITTTARGEALLVIRRANCTSRWELNLCQDQILDPVTSSLSWLSPQGDHNASDANESSRGTSDWTKRRPRDVFQQPIDIRQVTRTGERRLALPVEVPTSQSEPSSRRMQLRANVVDDKAGDITQLDLNDERQSTENDLHQKSIVNEGDEGARARLAGKDWIAFRHLTAAAALPPLPAYDGIGGSPSYYCENMQERRRPQRSVSRSVSRRNSRQAEGDDGQERSPDKQASVRIIREDIEEIGSEEEQGNAAEEEKGELEDVNDGMDAFTLDDSSSGMPETPHVIQKPLGVDESSTKSFTNWSNGVPSTSLDQDRYDPMYLMMQLFDLTVENRPQLLSDGPSLSLGLSVLDRTPEYETHKIGLLYVRDGKQRTEAAVLGNMGGSLRYLRFLRGLGTFTKLEGLPGYTGGLDATTNSDGKFGLIYKDECAQIMFHVATMMVPDSEIPDSSVSSGMFASMKKKRHIGNDFVHVVFKECDEEYDVQTLSGQFNDVHIVIQPLNDLEYRTQVHVKPGIAPFGPLYGTQIVASAVISESVRLTCLNANLACQVFHQDLVGFAMNCEERLKQIKQLGLRLAMPDEWKLDT